MRVTGFFTLLPAVSMNGAWVAWGWGVERTQETFTAHSKELRIYLKSKEELWKGFKEGREAKGRQLMSDSHFQTFLLAACEIGGSEIREVAGAAEEVSWDREVEVGGVVARRGWFGR